MVLQFKDYLLLERLPYLDADVSLQHALRLIKALLCCRRVMQAYNASQIAHSSNQHQGQNEAKRREFNLVPFWMGLCSVILVGEAGGTVVSLMRAKPPALIADDFVFLSLACTWILMYLDVKLLRGKILYALMTHAVIGTALEYINDVRRAVAMCFRVEATVNEYELSVSFVFHSVMPVILGTIQATTGSLLFPFLERYWASSSSKPSLPKPHELVQPSHRLFVPIIGCIMYVIMYSYLSWPEFPDLLVAALFITQRAITSPGIKKTNNVLVHTNENGIKKKS